MQKLIYFFLLRLTLLIKIFQEWLNLTMFVYFFNKINGQSWIKRSNDLEFEMEVVCSRLREGYYDLRLKFTTFIQKFEAHNWMHANNATRRHTTHTVIYTDTHSYTYTIGTSTIQNLCSDLIRYHGWSTEALESKSLTCTCTHHTAGTREELKLTIDKCGKKVH